MNLVHLQSFITVADHGSISGAARTLHISASSLLQQINLLEDEIGFKVFNRSHVGVSLTEPGEEFYACARELIDYTNTTLKKCRSILNDESSKIIIGGRTPYEMTAFSYDYVKLNPTIRFQFRNIEREDMAELTSKIASGTFDIIEYEYVPQLVSTEIAFMRTSTDCMGLICAPTHPLYRKIGINISDLCGYDVYISGDCSTATAMITKYIDDEKLPLSMQKVKYSDATALTCCVNGGVFLLERGYASRSPTMVPKKIFPEFPVINGIYYSTKGKKATLNFVEMIESNLKTTAE